jgi:membrane dipeptidase
MGDAEGAHAAGVRQLEIYQRWHEQGLIGLIASPRRTAHDPRASSVHSSVPLCLILMEGADPIREPKELAWWAERGVAAIGMAWARGSRYANGNGEPSCSSATGLTPIGRKLVREMDRLGVVHDASHLSDRALADLFAATDHPIIASHSNVRSLLDGVSQRHLTDDAIREIGRRGGVIGLNLVRHFIRTGLNRDDPGDRPSIAEAIDHVERIAEIMQRRSGVGMGSDLDGGISGHDLPRGIDRPRDFVRFAEELASRGWSDPEIEGFAWGNWARFWRLND